MEPLHKVTKEDLPIFHEWLKKHLPDSSRMYGMVCAELKGRWPGARYYTLGWPQIRAAGEGQVDDTESKCPRFFNHSQLFSVFGPDLADVEELVLRPDFLDWSKPLLGQANSCRCADVLEKISKETGTLYTKRTLTQLMIAYPGDIKPRPVPDGFEVGPIDPQGHAEYITSTWPHRQPHTESYITALVESFHSVGIFDRCGNLAAFELENECGLGSFLHVKDEYRGLGLAKCVISLLAQKFFEENRPFPAVIITSNTRSITIHEQLGFKAIGYLEWFTNSMTPDKVTASS
ncbi:hypothetical protein BsWGS_27868 [Bradybaena similaris]